ncbi:substrate-binding domain-containing protein [Mycolicibacterium arseniciresistens]|uniref:Substrate-binding domain-containing protein n=1 Tax=Mycolicibacterium arseniciresistens TaxID=3062257 RepID=A0ABT8UJW6_9MYCO|nr:substrate-binding domain-containing protein [Mycolicibacterium arseniciresistens]MDO3638094.1 substrate-binding domain-containing protein [Mycolicibacterium arseniciresistens]
MGRHSIPDPEDSADEPEIPPQNGTSAEDPGTPHPRPGRGHGEPGPPAEYRRPEYGDRRGQDPGYPDQDPDHDADDYPADDFPTTAHRRTEYSDANGRDTDYRDAGYGDPGHRAPGFRDSGYRDSDYRDPEHDQPDHGFGASRDRRRDEYGGFRGDDHPDDHPDDDVDDDYDDDYGPGGPPPSTPAGPQHSGDWDGGEWTGSHRAVASGRRGVSVGVIAALVTVVVVVAAVILWRFFGDALSDRSDVAAARCVDGELTVAVLADPSIAPQIETLANGYNETASPVGDRCVKIGVKPAGSDQVVNGFTGDWPADLGERPALWVPASSISAARLEAASGPQTIDDSRSLVTSPVLLAVRPQMRAALGQQNWSTLPRLQTNPTGLDGLNLPGWGSLKLALPRSGDSDASYLAAEAVAAASAPPGAPASGGMSAVNTLLAGQPKLADDKAGTAIDALVRAPDPATAPVHAVAVTEQQLFQRGASLPNAKNSLASWLPPGPTATADYPTVLLSGDWLSKEQVAAASEFARFMRKPEGLAELAKAGFRAEGATPPASDVTAFAPVSAPLSIGDSAMRATMADALTAPAKGSAVTIMLDQSMPAAEGNNSRMGNVVNALIPRIDALPPTAAVGLWTFDGAAGSSRVPMGPLSEPVGGTPRSQTLTTTLDSLASTSGGAVSFTTLRLVYNEALANFRPGQPNSVLVITEGPHTDQSLDGAGLQAFVREAFDPARPVAVNVIDFGSDSDQATWEAVAQTTRGTYQNLGTSSSPDLTGAITRFLG